MDAFALIGRYFWVLAIITTFMNVAIWKRQSRPYIEDRPELAEGYNRLIRNGAVWLNVPWIVMGVGITFGDVPTVWHYFRPQDENPYVLSWFGSIFFLWCAGVYWIFILDGASTLVNHPGSFNFSSPTQVKLILILCLAGGVAAVIMMYTMDFTAPVLH